MSTHEARVSRASDSRRKLASARKRSEARRLLQRLGRAGALGDADALVELGHHHLDGMEDAAGRTLVNRNEASAVECFRRAAELGDSDAMLHLGNILGRKALRRGLPADVRRRLAVEAMGWDRRALRRGNPLAAFNLAMSYLNLGRTKEAVRRFRALARAGDDDALLELAKAELYGVGTRRDVAGAIQKLERVARKESNVDDFSRSLAMLILASTAYDGWLVRRDFRSVVTWLKRAAEGGSAAARGMLEDLGEAV